LKTILKAKKILNFLIINMIFGALKLKLPIKKFIRLSPTKNLKILFPKS